MLLLFDNYSIVSEIKKLVERLKLKLQNREKGVIALKNLGKMVTGIGTEQKEQKENQNPELKGASAGGSRGKIKIKPFQGCQNQGKTAINILSKMIGF